MASIVRFSSAVEKWVKGRVVVTCGSQVVVGQSASGKFRLVESCSALKMPVVALDIYFLTLGEDPFQLRAL